MRYSHPARPTFKVSHREGRPPAAPTATASEEVTSQQVHPGIWSLALEAADGDWRRLEIITPTKIITHPYRVR